MSVYRARRSGIKKLHMKSKELQIDGQLCSNVNINVGRYVILAGFNTYGCKNTCQ